MNRSWAIAAFLSAVVAGTIAGADELAVEDIVHHANKVAFYAGKDARAQVHMTITDGQGRTRERRFVMLRQDLPDSDDLAAAAYRGEQRYYVFFQRPADVNRMVFMVWKKLEGDDDRWLYLPALDLVKRIAASDKRTSFVGSDFLYEDVSGRDVDEDKHRLVEVTADYYVLESTPLEPATVEFARYRSYIHKDSFVPVQVEFFDSQGTQYRVGKALAVETISGHPTITRSSMENLQTGSITEVTFSDVQYDLGLPDELFTERYLRSPPREYLR